VTDRSADTRRRYPGGTPLGDTAAGDAARTVGLPSGERPDRRDQSTLPPSVSRPAENGRPLGSGYLLDAPIGHGATGQVWRARRRDTGEPVAVKLLREELAEDTEVIHRFLREQRTLTSLRHPNLVAVRGLVAEEHTLAIVMDLVDGTDLRRAMHRGGLGRDEAHRVLAQIAGALAHVHRGGVVHRDVKPENVLLERTPTAVTARLTDFGIAHLADGTVLTRLSQLVGTPAYIAPELIAGREVTAAADVYGLGVIAYELLAGRRPFTTGNTFALLRAHMEERPGRPDRITDREWEVISACLAKQPETRPDAESLIGSFTDRAAGAAPPAPTPPASTRRDPVRRPAPPDEHQTVRTAPPPAAGPEAPAPVPSRRTRRAVDALVALPLVAAFVVGVVLFVVDTVGGDERPRSAPSPATGEYQVPISITAEDVGAATVALPGFDPDTAGISAYRIELKNAGVRTDTWTVAPDEPTERITDLDPNATYCIKVFAVADRPPPTQAPEGSNCVAPDGTPDG
jgi:hypothetical protein